MKLRIKLFCVLLVFPLLGCSTITPQKMEPFLSIQKPYEINNDFKENDKFPVVFMFSRWTSSKKVSDWTDRFLNKGIAVVVIDVSGVRGRKNQAMEQVYFGSDLSPALELAKNDPELDLSRYAVIGFSRGGTGAMRSGFYLSENQPKPDFAIALYPGDPAIGCPNGYSNGTEVLIFFGDADEWGNYNGTRKSCENTANRYENVHFYLLANTHHGYDDTSNFTWQCCRGKTFHNKYNPEALEKTLEVIFGKMKEKWSIN